MKDSELLESITKRLGVLIALQLRERPEKLSVAEGVSLLSRFELSPTEIAEILDTSTNTVNVTRSRLKKRTR